MGAIARQSGLPQNHIVLFQMGVPPSGFGLVTSFPPHYYAKYRDGVTEEIIPPAGTPRPDPDTAIRTKSVKLSPNMIDSASGPDSGHPACRFSGQMRQVIQMRLLNSEDPKFSHTFIKTHGIMEYPERVEGSTKTEENLLQPLRRFWCIEISENGIFAAPIKVTSKTNTCGQFLDPILNTLSGTVDLKTWYTNPSYNTTIKLLKTAAQMAIIYADGTPFGDTEMGWAFSYSGRKIMSVLAKFTSYWTVKVYDLSINVTIANTDAELTRIGRVVSAHSVGHGLLAGGLVVISGALPGDYNGIWTVASVVSDVFTYLLPEGVEPTSPATGTIRVENAAGDATLEVVVNEFVQTDTAETTQKKVDFQTGPVVGGISRGGASLLWKYTSTHERTPVSVGAITPLPLPIVDTPVHVYFDGETPIITRFYHKEESVTWTGADSFGEDSTFGSAFNWAHNFSLDLWNIRGPRSDFTFEHIRHDIADHSFADDAGVVGGIQYFTKRDEPPTEVSGTICGSTSSDLPALHWQIGGSADQSFGDAAWTLKADGYRSDFYKFIRMVTIGFYNSLVDGRQTYSPIVFREKSSTTDDGSSTVDTVEDTSYTDPDTHVVHTSSLTTTIETAHYTVIHESGQTKEKGGCSLVTCRDREMIFLLRTYLKEEVPFHVGSQESRSQAVYATQVGDCGIHGGFPGHWRLDSIPVVDSTFSAPPPAKVLSALAFLYASGVNWTLNAIELPASAGGSEFLSGYWCQITDAQFYKLTINAGSQNAINKDYQRGAMYYRDKNLTPDIQMSNKWYKLHTEAFEGGFSAISGKIFQGFIGLV